MRRSNAFLFAVAILTSLYLLTVADAVTGREEAAVALARERALVRSLGLTDLCLFTEARYTRHSTQADLHTPFQDHPLALEHFPAGSLLPPPRALRDPDARLLPQTEVPD